MKAKTITSQVLSSELIREILDDAKELEISRIEWLGGEPLLRRDSLELMEYSQKKGLINNMWTGGLPLADPEIAKGVVEFTQGGLVAFHVSSVNKDTYMRSHHGGSETDLGDILKGVENLLHFGKSADMILNSMTFTKLQSVEDICQTIDFFYDNYGISACINIYQFYEPVNRLAEEDREKYAPSIPDIRRVLNYAAKRSGKRYPLANCVNKYYCSATVAILNDARLTPCATIRPADAPKIFEEGFKNTFLRYRDELILKKLKDPSNLPDGCRDCPYNKECWGCRARAWDCFEDIYERDPACFRNPQNRLLSSEIYPS